ncbi:MAG TPA: hydrogenase expression/formation protein HypE [Polyangiaceae bacterium]|nr:hydrogenase expression/formation protein HypE [Polyangiaceae bacterium]
MSPELDFATASCPAPIVERDVVVLGHGSGGRLTSELIERMILPALRNPVLEALDDQAQLTLPSGERIAFTTDSYVVSPLFFPGGDIGDLAVNGTVNDLAMGGARPLALSLAFILEEGFSMETLRRVLASVRRAADRAGVSIVTGDTKVVDHGKGDGLFVNTAGVGTVPRGRLLGAARVRPGDAIVVSGTIGDHGVAVLGRRKGLDLGGDLRSDTQPLHQLAEALLSACPEAHAMRDPTRGGLASVLVEIAGRQGLGMEIEESAVPVGAEVRAACELLGLDPWFVANEGKLVAFVPGEGADRAVMALREHPFGRRAARIGAVTDAHPGIVVARTVLGGQRVIDLPLHEPLPRIC